MSFEGHYCDRRSSKEAASEEEEEEEAPPSASASASHEAPAAEASHRKSRHQPVASSQGDNRGGRVLVLLRPGAGRTSSATHPATTKEGNTNFSSGKIAKQKLDECLVSPMIFMSRNREKIAF